MKVAIRILMVLTFVVWSAPGSPGQTVATGRVMREKLTHSQKVLEAIMTSDFVLLERESGELTRATESPAWSVFNTPEYARQSAAFLRAIQDLSADAKARDLDAAALHYVSLTLTCFQCHRYMKGARLATP